MSTTNNTLIDPARPKSGKLTIDRHAFSGQSRRASPVIEPLLESHQRMAETDAAQIPHAHSGQTVHPTH